MDALALSDRFLRNGASDRLLQLLIERGEENHSISGQPQGYGGHNIWSNSWQYCLRLKDKQLAARLALKYVWVFSINVVNACLNFGIPLDNCLWPASLFDFVFKCEAVLFLFFLLVSPCHLIFKNLKLLLC